jgi:hypothetical protein
MTSDDTTRSSFDDLLARCLVWRRWLAGQPWVRFLPDVDAEIVAAIWELYAAGVDDPDRMFAHARVRVTRLARQERRFARSRTFVDRSAAGCFEAEAPERVLGRLDATRAVAGLTVPPRAQRWVCAVTFGAPASPAAMKAGRRWANQVRDNRLAVRHAA